MNCTHCDIFFNIRLIPQLFDSKIVLGLCQRQEMHEICRQGEC